MHAVAGSDSLVLFSELSNAATFFLYVLVSNYLPDSLAGISADRPQACVKEVPMLHYDVKCRPM